MISYPKNRIEWWKSVDDNWSDLFGILCQFLPAQQYADIHQKILPHTLSVEITKLKENQNDELAHYFQAAWSLIPNVQGLREIPGWLKMCDLCSESHILESEERHQTERRKEMRYIMEIKPALVPEERHQIQDCLELLGYRVSGGGTTADMSCCDISFDNTEFLRKSDELISNTMRQKWVEEIDVLKKQLIEKDKPTRNTTPNIKISRGAGTGTEGKRVD